MKRSPVEIVVAVLVVLMLSSAGCAQALTAEQTQTVANLRDDLKRIQEEVAQATQEEAKYGSGLIKALVGVRLQILKTNAALVEQRVHALEGGARQTVVVNSAKLDPRRADELTAEIAAQTTKVAEARQQANRYSGGLVQALSLTTAATAENTLAMLEQQYYIAKYGIAMPALSAGPTAAPTTSGVGAPSSPADQRPSKADTCLKIETYDSSVLSSNDSFTELAWKVDVANSCTEPFSLRVTFKVLDKDDFELDTDSEDILVPASGTGKARGKMLINPPEKARRMTKQGVSLSVR